MSGSLSSLEWKYFLNDPWNVFPVEDIWGKLKLSTFNQMQIYKTSLLIRVTMKNRSSGNLSTAEAKFCLILWLLRIWLCVTRFLTGSVFYPIESQLPHLVWS